jgi:hypothetical protein
MLFDFDENAPQENYLWFLAQLEHHLESISCLEKSFVCNFCPIGRIDPLLER